MVNQMSSANLVHVIADFAGVSRALLDDPDQLLVILSDGARYAGLVPINSFAHKFHPWGVSAILIIAESHISIHTWPEEGFAAVDVLSCKSKESALGTLEYIRLRLMPSKVRVEIITRSSALDHVNITENR